jgi:GTP-binding protein EngB required for normal cell division
VKREGVNFGDQGNAGRGSPPAAVEASGSPPDLERLAALARSIGAEEIAAEALRLRERTSEGRFFVTCVGQYKRGKSTLLNALIGAAVLPVGVAPVTSVVTIVRHGVAPRARARMSSGDWAEIEPVEISEYVTEARNPGNVKQIAAVELFWPSPLLEKGMCLVDTPGLGSVVAANTAATRDFLPHVDAALVVLGADPPISKEELELVEAIAGEVADLVFVINKADRLPATDVEEARRFSERVLTSRVPRPLGVLLVVSAGDRIRGAETTRDWEALEDRLRTLGKRRHALVHTADLRGQRRITGRLLNEVGEQVGALQRPLQESERRIETLRRCIEEAERSLLDLGALFGAEQRRLAARFAEQQERFLARTLPAARERLVASLRECTPTTASAFRRRGLALAQTIFADALDPWRQEALRAAETLYADAAGRFVDLADAFLDRLATSGVAGLETFRQRGATEVGFATKSRVVFTEMLTLTSQSPIAWLRDVCLSRARAGRRIEREAVAYLERLFVTNSSRLKNNLDEQVRESRLRLEAEIRDQLRRVCITTERALELARARLAAGTDAVSERLERLEAIREDVANLDIA